jgi:polysaccharide pyruvyl transferase WcaK-like protein
MRALLLNDTRCDPNPGCQATVAGLLGLLSERTAASIDTISLGYGYEHFAALVENGNGRAAAEWLRAVDSLSRDSHLTQAIASADLVVANLEGTFHHHTVGALALGGALALAHRLDKRVWAVNGTVEDIEPWLLAEAFARCEHLSVREPVSGRWLRRQGLRATTAADCAFLADIFSAPAAHLPAGGGSRLALYTPGVLGRPDQVDSIGADEAVAQLDVLTAAGWAPVYFEMEPAEAAITTRVADRGYPIARVADVPWPAVGNYLRHFDLVVSGRYHVLMFAAMAGVPFVALRSNTWKIAGLIEMTGGHGVATSSSDLARLLCAACNTEGVRAPRLEWWRRGASRALPRLRLTSGREHVPSGSPVIVSIGPPPTPALAALLPSGRLTDIAWPPRHGGPDAPARALQAALGVCQSSDGAVVAVSGFEHVAAGEIPGVLRTLRAHAPESLLACVDCAPAAEYNHRRLTIRPASVWQRLFERAGFDVMSARQIPSVAEAGHGEWSARSHWVRLNPFREKHPAAPWVFELRPGSADVDASAVADMDRMLGNRPRVTVPQDILDTRAHLFFLVGTYQEFRQYQPVWSQLPPSTYTVLLRVTQPEPTWIRRERAIEAWCATRGIHVMRVSSIADVDWHAWRQRRCVLVAGADSTAFMSHILNAAFVDSARRHGWRTVQLQHGIWPYASLQKPMTMLSELVLAWSPEFKQSLDTVVQWPDGSRGPRGEIEGIRFVTAGCPVFDRYADADAASLDDLLGDWVRQYRRTVLVATNLHWSAHKNGALANAAVFEAAASMPDTLFIVKPHPVHDPDEAFLSACPANVQVLDEFCCLFADLDSARLVRATDAVVATLSTVALEAALAGRPFLVMDTGNPNSYEHVTATPPEQIVERVNAMFTAHDDVAAFRDYYFAVETLGDGTSSVLGHLATELRRTPRAAGLHARAAEAFVDTVSAQSAEVSTLQRALDAARQERASIEANYSALQDDRDRLRTEVEKLQADHRRVLDVLRGHHQNWLYSRSGERWRVALFGASSLGRSLAARLRTIPRVDVRWFFDNDSQKWGQQVDGIPVVRPDAESYEMADVIVVTSVYIDEIIRQVTDAGWSHKLILDVTLLEAGDRD